MTQDEDLVTADHIGKVVLSVLHLCKKQSDNLQDMASDEMKKLRQQITKEGIREAQVAKNEGTATSLFKCGKCGQRKTSYNQASDLLPIATLIVSTGISPDQAVMYDGGCTAGCVYAGTNHGIQQQGNIGVWLCSIVGKPVYTTTFILCLHSLYCCIK